MLRACRLAMLAAASMGLAGCSSAPPPPTQRFETILRVTSDDEEPLPRAQFAVNDHPFGVTGPNGTLSVVLRGTEGQLARLTLTCPLGYSAPEALPPLRLTTVRRPGEATPQPLTLDAVCTRDTRRVGLVVRSLPGTALPVLVDGKPITTTDPDGNAHVLLEVDRSQRALTVRLDTSKRTDLMPQNPERRFELNGRDNVLYFAPELQEPKRPVARRSAPKKHVPYRLE